MYVRMYGTDLPSITFMHITTATYVALVTYKYLPKTTVMLCKLKRQSGNYGIAMCIVKQFRGTTGLQFLSCLVQNILEI